MAAEDLNGEVITEGECTDCTTQERSFDALTRRLANGTLSRRKALWLLGGALMGSALGFTPRAASAAKCKPLARKCAANVQCCSRFCDKQGQVCACPPRTTLACQGPTGQARCINICHDPTNECEQSACNPATGGCVVQKLSGTPCTDSNPCTLVDTCQNGTCNPGPVRTCGQCLRCNPANGTCEPDANQAGNPCGDQNACTQNDRCNAAGVCVGEPVDCDDNNPCTVDTCDPTTGCVHTPVTNGTLCDDGDPCTLGDTCQNGTCRPGEPLECGQCLTCEGGVCVPDQGQNGTGCDDDNPCTANDTCQSGLCIGTPMPGCVVCATPADCQVPTNPCLQATCVSRVCGVEPKQDGTQCDDENACTKNETCQSGVCIGEPVDCDDNNPCTIDTCDPTTGCVHTNVVDNTPCDTGNLCTADTCQNGTCTQGSANVSCGQCLRCNPDTGTCVPDLSKNGTGCNDGNACTTGETCQGGVCTGGTLRTCSACQQCNPLTGNCEPVTGASCGPSGSGRTCCAGSCCGTGDICCPTGPSTVECRRRSGQGCTQNRQCCSGSCVSNVCA
jgi:hypothetical protein